MVEIELKSKELKEYVYLKLDKDRNYPIYDEDINKFNEITLNGLDLLDEPTDVTIFDLIFFKNLKLCTFINMNISEKEIDVLNNMKNVEFIQFSNCIFPKDKQVKLVNIKQLVFDNCLKVEISKFNSSKQLNSLKIVNCDNIIFDGLEICDNLRDLYLQNLELQDIDIVSKLKNLEYLNLNGTKVKKKMEISKSVMIEHKDLNYIYDLKN